MDGNSGTRSSNALSLSGLLVYIYIYILVDEPQHILLSLPLTFFSNLISHHSLNMLAATALLSLFTSLVAAAPFALPNGFPTPDADALQQIYVVRGRPFQP